MAGMLLAVPTALTNSHPPMNLLRVLLHNDRRPVLSAHNLSLLAQSSSIDRSRLPRELHSSDGDLLLAPMLLLALRVLL